MSGEREGRDHGGVAAARERTRGDGRELEDENHKKELEKVVETCRAEMNEESLRDVLQETNFYSRQKEYNVMAIAYQKMEDQLSYALLLSSLVVLANLFFLAAGFLYADILTNALCFLVSMGLMMVLQQKVVDQTRRMNPEKKGSVYDVNFQKKWLDSCDELERAQIGQASFRAFKAANGACAALWLVLMLLSLVADIGLLPILVAVLVWGVLQVSYTLECIRLSHRGSR